MVKAGQRGISLPKEEVDEVERFLQEHPWLGYTSATDFIRCAVKSRLGQERTFVLFATKEQWWAARVPRCPNCKMPLELGREDQSGTPRFWVCSMGCGIEVPEKVRGPRPPTSVEDDLTAEEKKEEDEVWEARKKWTKDRAIAAWSFYSFLRKVGRQGLPPRESSPTSRQRKRSSRKR